MFKSRKIQLVSTILTVVALLLGIMALVWNIILYNHRWNHHIFRENHYVDGILATLCITVVSTFIFWIVFLFLKKGLRKKSRKIMSAIAFGLYNLAAIASIIFVLYFSISFGRDFEDYTLDRQLACNDISKVHESVDSIIARSHNHDFYCESDINEYMMKAARNGYAPAQNYVGVYFHEKAKERNDNHFGHHKWSLTETSFCQEELTRATYWWLKAATQNYGRAQENLGRMKMHSILSNQSYSYGEAKYWLTEATKNGVISAYYYLGLLSRDRSLSDAEHFWSIGAQKGNEDCIRMLENPDFIDVKVTVPDQ